MPNAKIGWKILDSKGAEKAKGQLGASMAEDSVQQLGAAEWTVSGKGPHQLRAEVRDQAGKTVSENIFEFEVTD